MSRIAKTPIKIPDNVVVSINGNSVKIKGKLGEMSLNLHKFVVINQSKAQLSFDIAADIEAKSFKLAWAQAGTARANVNNCIIGVVSGFEKKLKLVGVGYRAKIKAQQLDLQLGYSHAITYSLPKDIEIKTPSANEIIIRGYDKQKVGQVAAEIRAYRLPEPYKGKGIRYEDEQIIKKEAKKKK